MNARLISAIVVGSVAIGGCMSEAERIQLAKERQEFIEKQEAEKAKLRAEEEKKMLERRKAASLHSLEAYWKEIAEINITNVIWQVGYKTKGWRNPYRYDVDGRMLCYDWLKNWIGPRKEISKEEANSGDSMLEEFGTRARISSATVPDFAIAREGFLSGLQRGS